MNIAGMRQNENNIKPAEPLHKEQIYHSFTPIRMNIGQRMNNLDI